MGNCESNCFAFYAPAPHAGEPPLQTVTILGSSYPNCDNNVHPFILDLVYEPHLDGNDNGYTTVKLTTGQELAFLHFTDNMVKSLIAAVPGVGVAFDFFGNVNIFLNGPIPGLKAGKDYIVGDLYKIRTPSNNGGVSCHGNEGFMVFYRGAGPAPSSTLKEFYQADADNHRNMYIIIGVILAIVLVYFIFKQKRKYKK
jgi:hypothetical protein